MKRWFLFFSCDVTTQQCVGYAPLWNRWERPVPLKLSDHCLPDAPYRYHNSLVIDGKPQFGCHNRCAGFEGPFSTSVFRRLCGACRKGDHENCSNWCFCDCEFN